MKESKLIEILHESVRTLERPLGIIYGAEERFVIGSVVGLSNGSRTILFRCYGLAQHADQEIEIASIKVAILYESKRKWSR